jgi:hypothetical protein
MIMSRFTGQILRIVGLLIEMLGILAAALRTRRDQADGPLPEFISTRLIWTVVGVGFVIWLIGSILTYWPRSHRKRRDPDRDDMA